MFQKAAFGLTFALIVSFQVLLVGALIMRVIERRALRRGTTAAFRRGVMIIRARAQFRSLTAPSGALQTAQGAGQWLTEDAFGFWSRDGYSARSQCVAWVGLCTVTNEEAIFEVRLLRSRALQLAAILAWLFMMVVIGVFPVVSGEFVFLVGALGIVALLAFVLARAFRRERAVAEDVVREFRERFERA